MSELRDKQNYWINYEEWLFFQWFMGEEIPEEYKIKFEKQENEKGNINSN